VTFRQEPLEFLDTIRVVFGAVGDEFSVGAAHGHVENAVGFVLIVGLTDFVLANGLQDNHAEVVVLL